MTIAGVGVGAGVEQDLHGVDSAGTRRPHQRRQPVLVALVGVVLLEEQRAHEVGGVAGGDDRERQRRFGAAGGRRDQRDPDAQTQHEAVHEVLRGDHHAQRTL